MELFKDHYERKTENEKDLLRVFRNRVPNEEKTDPPPDVYVITSLNKDEMVLLETIGNNTFWSFKKQ
ncbi:MAG: hypothetical protein M3Y85_07350 [Bacteroidota bacterium]|nr:hypothetical protein [Bacteroidota bacterium]